MSIQKTLGGDRLGSGKRMKVELHNYERSTHDLSYLWRSTMSAGTLVPFLVELGLPGDTFDIDLNAEILTLPTAGPLFGSYKVQLDTFMCPIRLYNSHLHNNTLGIGLDIKKVKFPVIDLVAGPNTGELTKDAADIDNSQINPSCILSYLGIRGVGQNNTGEVKYRSFNAIPLLAYWEIYKNYFSNKQEEIGAVIHRPGIVVNETVDEVKAYSFNNGMVSLPLAPANTTVVFDNPNDQLEIVYTGTQPDPATIILDTVEHGEITMSALCNDFFGTTTLVGVYDYQRWGQTTLRNWRYITGQDINDGEPRVVTFELANIDQMRSDILAFQSTTAPFKLNDHIREPYQYLFVETQNPATLSTQEGLAVKTYQSDLFNNWLSKEWIDGVEGINAITAVSTAGDSFTIDTLNLAKKVYDMLNRIAVSGGTYDDWLDAVYVHDRYTRAESPVYMGGLSKELVFQEVISNTTTEGQPLGTLAGRGRLSSKHKGGKVVIKVDEPCFIIGLISLTPRIDYSQGNAWFTGLQTMDDLHKPQLDQIGFQDLVTEQMAWWDTYWDDVNEKWVQRSAGKQPAWINYMTRVNETRGNFAMQNKEMFMTLNRRYEFDKNTESIKDLTTYIDPTKFNFIFAETSLDAQNFWAQVAVDMIARRKMSAKVMPNL